MSRRIEGLDVTTERTNGAVWARAKPGQGWFRLGRVNRDDATWGWKAVPESGISDAAVGRIRVFSKQGTAIEYVVREAIFLGRITPEDAS